MLIKIKNKQKTPMNPILRNLLIFLLVCVGIALLIVLAMFGSVIIKWITGFKLAYVIVAVISSFVTVVICGIIEMFSRRKSVAEAVEEEQEQEEQEEPANRRRRF